MKLFRFSIILCLILTASQSGDACTTFLISGKSTPDGKPILYKNRDTDKLQNALVSFSDGKYKYVGLVDCSETSKNMVWGGYNETGFAIINSAAYNNNIGDSTKLIDREGVVMKLALQNCRTLEDFEQLLLSLPKPLGVDANFGVIDAAGGAAYYETGNFRFIKYDANDPAVAPDGILIRTNYSHSADPAKGYGFCRYNTAKIALNKAFAEKDLSPQHLFNAVSRNLTHSLTGTDLTTDLPSNKDIPSYKFFTDYIPRFSTASVVMIIGAQDQTHAGETMMWTILGFPLTSVAVPVWISADNRLPASVKMGENQQSPLCNFALKLKENCFPLHYGNGKNYINLAVVVNKQNTGYLQQLQPVENEIFSKAEKLTSEFEKGKKSDKMITEFYVWLDKYLQKNYKELFNLSLFEE